MARANCLRAPPRAPEGLGSAAPGGSVRRAADARDEGWLSQSLNNIPLEFHTAHVLSTSAGQAKIRPAAWSPCLQLLTGVRVGSGRRPRSGSGSASSGPERMRAALVVPALLPRPRQNCDGTTRRAATILRLPRPGVLQMLLISPWAVGARAQNVAPRLGQQPQCCTALPSRGARWTDRFTLFWLSTVCGIALKFSMFRRLFLVSIALVSGNSYGWCEWI